MDRKVKYYNDLSRIPQLSDAEKADLQAVADKFVFRTNSYYLSLIDWDDPADPIRRMIIPQNSELEQWGDLDPSNEAAYKIMPGLEHKYDSTALILVSEACDSICRYCFRKRVFMDASDDRIDNVDEMLDYIRTHTEISNVLLTGGDPLTLSTEKLEMIIAELRKIEHIRIIRIGSKLPVFNPYRIIDDPSLAKMVEKYSLPDRKIYVMTHFMHPNELTETAVKGLNILQNAGAIVNNQCPVLRGVNDNPAVLAELWRELSFAGVIPYYAFQCRPALGNRDFTVPIEEAYDIVEQAKARVSGLAKRVRFAMSHSTGKIEIAAKTRDYILFKYHRAQDNTDSSRILVCKRNPNACWLDDYEEVVESFRPADKCWSLKPEETR
ncbi:L-lysine 2,3-aminomutase [Anaerohalosphaera lusitana]|uniref:L-lysine 2,3-aminomutase n=1 Tax=Anaerohalosphaera lusitana TaxID=1936003 RepID=A0A1U9NRJ5_9BACT|nr:KamA family radical SAM protein [Anaerohalosphaera lusitana]AQT70328.1 L-lysine 2,3-aminomutase [Anaerohalosphaera lusitana]